MSLFPENARAAPPRPDWYYTIARHERPSLRKAVWQILTTLIPYLLFWLAMVVLMRSGYPYGIVLLLAVPGALFLVRLFILFHDCTHGSLFASKRANTVFGYVSGVLTFTAFEKWRAGHWMHHATVADLDRRGRGDVWTMTKEEFLKASGGQRLAYRLYRNPFIMFGIGPLFSFLVYQRFYPKGASKRERISIYITDLAVLAIIVLAGVGIGIRNYLLIQLPMLYLAGITGFWLFYVQHQFKGVYWSRHEEWDRMKAALEGSSTYLLPPVLRWFTGNIGYHSAHHVRPLIPNYNLRAAHEAAPDLRAVKPLTIRASLHSLWLRLWDEAEGKLIGYRAAKAG
jgi:omega-6 fatty acid desaturase (delta-12 desaturase)